MPSNLMTPGVYIEEKNAFPSSAVAVETAVPVFIGYTDIAEWNGKSLQKIPTRITSFSEYAERFGGAFHAKFKLTEPDPAVKQDTFSVDGKQMVIEYNKNNIAYMFNSIRLFYNNGGGPAYILSVGTYNGKSELEIKQDDFGDAVFEILKKESEPTLVVIPDAIALGDGCYKNIYTKVLQHCSDMQSRFGIFDVRNHKAGEDTNTLITEFREGIGSDFLKYGAAYYPWLKTGIVLQAEVTYENLDASVDLNAILPEPQAKQVIEKLKPEADKYALLKEEDKTADDRKAEADAKRNYHQTLNAASPTYSAILDEVRAKLNELPPSGAMAGIYNAVDTSRGVWKSPANVSVSGVSAPSVNISHEEQETINVDAISGKSINVIRSFPGIGTLVWGGRTLDGNSQDWRYINVRRTVIMIEQSLKLAARAYVFEPNDANTWVTVRSMMLNFLTNLWKQGALAGSAPDQAFDVQIGLGATMTPTDILDGIMMITVKVAIVRPAEFIVITFLQKMQQS
ncbi:MAG: phage tail sheath family protein [Bacteroidia bacterium]|nr:phage tail sheath family protein [Bacteroidia bacterium]